MNLLTHDWGSTFQVVCGWQQNPEPMPDAFLNLYESGGSVVGCAPLCGVPWENAEHLAGALRVACYGAQMFDLHKDRKKVLDLMAQYVTRASINKYMPGTTYKPIGKKSEVLHTVRNVLITRDLSGAQWGVCYVATHEFMGQTLTETNVIETTISRGLVNAVRNPNIHA